MADSSSEEEGEGGGAQARLSKRALKKQRKEELEAAAVIEGQPIASGIGHALLQKMGWGDGQGLGKNAEGIVEPVKAAAAAGKRGLAADDESCDATDAASKRPRKEAAAGRELAGREEASKEGTSNEGEGAELARLEASLAASRQLVEERTARVRGLREELAAAEKALAAAKRAAKEDEAGIERVLTTY